jgi:hypothetical protein
MSNDKVQINVKTQISNTKCFGIETFVIHLTFACLPQAGISTFGILNFV